jgi:hypothetical protein
MGRLSHPKQRARSVYPKILRNLFKKSDHFHQNFFWDQKDQKYKKATQDDYMSVYRDIIPTKQEPWYHDMTVGTRWSVETEGIMAILAARTVMLGEPPVTQSSCSGFYADDANPAKVLEVLHATLPGLKKVLRYTDFSEEDRQDGYDYWFFHETGAIHLSLQDKSGDVEYIGNSHEIAQKLFKAFEPVLINVPPTGTVYMMTATERGPEFHSVGVGGHVLERNNYDPEVLEGYDRIKAELKAANPRGRLTILNGPAGTGKTYLIRGLLQEVTGTVFVVVPPHALPSLSEPAALTALSKLRRDHQDEPIVLVVEDADECLARREEGNLSAISAVLNIGDGLMGSVMDVRIVATTNAMHQDFDPAIKRPGRLSTSMTVGKIKAELANQIYKRLTGKDEVICEPLKEMMLAEVYQKAYDGGWKPLPGKKKSVGFGG